MENLQQSTYENAGRLMNLYDYMAAIGDDNYENLYDDITQDVDVRYRSDDSDYQEWVDQLAKEHDLFSKESMEKINARFEPQIFVADDSAKIAPVVYDNQYDTYLTLDKFADELESYADMDIEGENEVYQEGYFSPYYMDEPPTKKVSFSGTLETSMRELVQDFYQWLGEIDDEIAQQVESRDENMVVLAAADQPRRDDDGRHARNAGVRDHQWPVRCPEILSDDLRRVVQVAFRRITVQQCLTNGVQFTGRVRGFLRG